MLISMSAAREWDRNTQQDTAAGLERNTPAAKVGLDQGHDVDKFTFPRVGFQGLRSPVSLERIVSLFMPGVPGGPPQVIANRDESIRGGRPAVAKIKPAAQFTPVVSVEQTAPYWEYLQS